MGKAYEVPTGNAPPLQPETPVQPSWAAQLNSGARDVGSSGNAPAPVSALVAPMPATEPPMAPAIPLIFPKSGERPSPRTTVSSTSGPVVPSAPAIQSPVPTPLTVALPNQAVETLIANNPPPAPAVAVASPAVAEKLVCLTGGCKCKQKLRGLCAKCHPAAIKWIDDNREKFPKKEEGWAWLETNGFSLPLGKPSSDKLFLDGIELHYNTTK